MYLMSEIIEKKKRGRKPKMFTLINKIEQPQQTNINTEEEKIILHLPVTINEINNSYILNDTNDYDVDDIFIKPENNINNFGELLKYIKALNLFVKRSNQSLFDNINNILMGLPL